MSTRLHSPSSEDVISYGAVKALFCWVRRTVDMTRMMNRYLLTPLVLLLAMTGTTVLAHADRPPRVRPVASVDLDRYVGLWYEVAKIPNRFQKQCARGTTAEYTLREDGQITVVNRCVTEDGSPEEAEGVAKVVDKRSNARLEVSFVSFAGWRPFWGDYWVIGLDADYRWAVVGTPDRKYGWILGRTPTLDDDDLESAYAILERNGYRREAFVLSLP